MTRTIATLLACALFVAAPAYAQDDGDYRDRLNDLVTISGIFGEMHHIRRNCDPRREGDVWRDRMKKLIDFEGPQGPARERMVGAFNDGYRAAQRRFDYCDRDARDYAARRAATGDAIVARLMAPLYSSLGQAGQLGDEL
ncbi:MAG: TIGR02301 family protein [Pseudomonadota bacterium]